MQIPAGSLALNLILNKNITSLTNNSKHPHSVLVENIWWYHVSTRVLSFMISTNNWKVYITLKSDYHTVCQV